MCRNIKFMGKAAGRKGRRYYWNHPPHQRTHSTHLVGTTIQIQRVVCLLHTYSTASVQEFPFQCLNDSLTTFLQASKPVVSFVMYPSTFLPVGMNLCPPSSHFFLSCFAIRYNVSNGGTLLLGTMAQRTCLCALEIADGTL